MVTTAAVAAFAPDDFNYAFAQSRDRHAPPHVIPRHPGLRECGGSRPDESAHARGVPAVPVNMRDADLPGRSPGRLPA